MIDTLIVNVGAPFVATVTYVALFNVPKRFHLSCGVCGIISWMVYYLTAAPTSDAVASFLAILVSAFLARMLSVRMKCPVTIFMLACIIPVVPGAGVYFTVFYVVTDQLSLAAGRGLETVKMMFAMALGLAFVVSIPKQIFQIHYWRGLKWKRHTKAKKNKENES